MKSDVYVTNGLVTDWCVCRPQRTQLHPRFGVRQSNFHFYCLPFATAADGEPHDIAGQSGRSWLWWATRSRQAALAKAALRVGADGEANWLCSRLYLQAKT